MGNALRITISAEVKKAIHLGFLEAIFIALRSSVWCSQKCVERSLVLYFWSVSHHTSLFFPVFFPWFFPLFYFPLFFFTVFSQCFPPILFIQGLVSFVLCICLKIGLGRETFSCNHKHVRLFLWKALQSGRALFRLEDYYIVGFVCK